MKLNENFGNLTKNYLFAQVSQKVLEFTKKNPEKSVYRLGIGDVTLPIPHVVTEAMEKAAAEMGVKETFKGYPDYEGYMFLRTAIKDYYSKKGVSLTEDEIFINDGAKNDTGNFAEIFSKDNIVLVADPVYPVYVDSNIMAGREIRYIEGNIENSFLPMPDENTVGDIIYLCSPNNPTGAVYSRQQLKVWVDWANERDAIILFDAAYEIFVNDTNCPASIFEVEGADTCAVEFCSLSKTAGFTGVRCGYTVIPQKLIRGGESINRTWLRRQSTKFNGVSYIVQRGAEAVFTEKGLSAIHENIDYYMENAKIIADTLSSLKVWFTGGKNSPYIWLKCPHGMKSWEFFDNLLEKANVVGTPGVGFGNAGEGFFRLSSFGEKETILKAMERFREMI